MAFRAVDAGERMALEHDVAHVRHHHLVVMPGAAFEVIEIDRVAPRMDRARERARLEHPRDIDAATLEITADGEARPADQHHHVAAVSRAAQRLDEHPDLGDAESDRRAEHEPARIGGGRGKADRQRAPMAHGAAAPGRWRLHYPRCPRIANRGKIILPRLPGGWLSDREVGWGPRAAANEERAPPCPPRSRGGKILRNEYEQSDIASSFRGARQREPGIQPFSARVSDSGFRLRRRRNDGDRSRSPPCGAWNDG